ncbi:MAG: hypothetical protein AB1815_02400 [Bacillota bacterium]
MTPEKTPTNPRGAGRKPAAPEDKYRSRNIKFTDAEWEKVKKLAIKAGVSTSEYVRQKALQS